MPESAIGASGEAPGAALTAQATTSEDHSRSRDHRGVCRRVIERTVAAVLLLLYAPLMAVIAAGLKIRQGHAFTRSRADTNHLHFDVKGFLGRTGISQLPMIFDIAKGDLPLSTAFLRAPIRERVATIFGFDDFAHLQHCMVENHRGRLNRLSEEEQSRVSFFVRCHDAAFMARGEQWDDVTPDEIREQIEAHEYETRLDPIGANVVDIAVRFFPVIHRVLTSTRAEAELARREGKGRAFDRRPGRRTGGYVAGVESHAGRTREHGLQSSRVGGSRRGSKAAARGGGDPPDGGGDPEPRPGPRPPWRAAIVLVLLVAAAGVL